MKKIAVFLLMVPFVYNTLNLQGFITHFGSISQGQLSAYVMMVFVIAGTTFFINDRHPFPLLISLWLWYYAFYFFFGTIADYMNDVIPSYLKASVPLIYFIGFSFFLSFDANRTIYIKVAQVTFFLATIATIYLEKINFSMDKIEILNYKMDRAGGVYGDANQAALVSLITFILIFHHFTASKRYQKVLKFIVLAITVYAIILTFSKTGLVVLLIVLGLSYHTLFTPKKLLFVVILVPLTLFGLINLAMNSESLSIVQKERVENVKNLITFNTAEVQFSSRDVLLKNMLNYIYDSPIIGNGVSFSNKIRGHNTIIGVWADAGILTFLLFLIILGRYFFKSWYSPINIRYFGICIIIVLTIFMLSLQTVINQPYIVTLFVYLAFIIDRRDDIASVPSHSIS